LHGDPRDKHDNDFIPSDDDSDHGYGHPGVGIGPVPDFYASTSFANELGSLAGGKPSKGGELARREIGEEQYQLVLAYERGCRGKAETEARSRYVRFRKYNNTNMQGSSQQQGESSQKQGESPQKLTTRHITHNGWEFDVEWDNKPAKSYSLLPEKESPKWYRGKSEVQR
jgi:hypothetical protein